MYGHVVMLVWTLGILGNACVVSQPIRQHWGVGYVYVVVIGCKEVNVSECALPLDVLESVAQARQASNPGHLKDVNAAKGNLSL